MKETEPEIKELSEFLQEFNGESDRGAVLTAGAYLDERLSEMLKGFLAEVKETDDLLFGFNAPIGTFSSRIKAAYSLGLIQENEFKELNTIRKIRNEFGHSWKKVSFETQQIKDLCSNLPWLGPTELEEEANAKGRFNFAVAILLTDFLWRARLVKKEQREIKIWPNKSRSE
jgi:DNA-binding MltR family transcriptional regulator